MISFFIGLALIALSLKLVTKDDSGAFKFIALLLMYFAGCYCFLFGIATNLALLPLLLIGSVIMVAVWWAVEPMMACVKDALHGKTPLDYGITDFSLKDNSEAPQEHGENEDIVDYMPTKTASLKTAEATAFSAF